MVLTNVLVVVAVVTVTVVFLFLFVSAGCYCLVVGLVVCRGGPEEDTTGTSNSPGQWKVSDLDIVLPEPTEGPRSPQGGDGNSESWSSY